MGVLMQAPRVVMTVYGTRPEAIKVAPVIAAIAEDPRLTNSIVVTGQHREMLDEVNALFNILPDYDLDIMRHGQTLSQIAARVLVGLDPILDRARPDAVMVQGDTTTSTAAALAAFHREIPVIHLEAGLRSHDIASPFPEEANRRITSQVAALHLAPTSSSKANLLREGIDEASIVVTGNTVIDALQTTVNKALAFDDEALTAVAQSDRRVVLVTAHRRESWGEAMEGIGRALGKLAQQHPDVTFVLPAHRNPVVREAVLPLISALQNVLVLEPLPYGQFARLLERAYLVLTDSGGVQEEAPSLGTPVLVMRENTERAEAVHAGTVRLIGTSEQRIVDEVDHLLDDQEHYASMANATNPYGDGQAAARAVAAILQHAGLGTRLPDFAVRP